MIRRMSLLETHWDQQFSLPRFHGVHFIPSVSENRWGTLRSLGPVVTTTPGHLLAIKVVESTELETIVFGRFHLHDD